MITQEIEKICEKTCIDPRLVRSANAGQITHGRDYVLLWMQKAQRAYDNPALDFAINAAHELHLPLLVLFVLTEYPAASWHHYAFMLEGLKETADELRAMDISFCIRKGNMVETVLTMAADAAMLVGDEGRLLIERQWRTELAGAPSLPMFVLIETEAVVPAQLAAVKLAWSAAQLRPRIAAHLPHFLAPSCSCLEKLFHDNAFDALSDDALFCCAPLGAGEQGNRFPLLKLQKIGLRPGYRAGMGVYSCFLKEKLALYKESRNDPNAGTESNMSPYLHFGQVSARRLAVLALDTNVDLAQPYIEQLIVRRELALNFVLFSRDYRDFAEAVPLWARESLKNTARTDVYDVKTLESAETGDRYWNAAQREMILTGKMHNYMRMYWGKKMLAWFADPREAFSFAVSMNDRYSLDGRDPNGYAGIAWCFGRHDRPWPRKPLFGTVRSMTADGLRRKFDAELYADRIERVYNERKMEVP
jgi:deoxyribodipyrimidine photo-lyase